MRCISSPSTVILLQEDDLADFIENDLSDDEAPVADARAHKQERRQINLSDSEDD